MEQHLIEIFALGFRMRCQYRTDVITEKLKHKRQFIWPAHYLTSSPQVQLLILQRNSTKVLSTRNAFCMKSLYRTQSFVVTMCCRVIWSSQFAQTDSVRQRKNEENVYQIGGIQFIHCRLVVFVIETIHLVWMHVQLCIAYLHSVQVHATILTMLLGSWYVCGYILSIKCNPQCEFQFPNISIQLIRLTFPMIFLCLQCALRFFTFILLSSHFWHYIITDCLCKICVFFRSIFPHTFVNDSTIRERQRMVNGFSNEHRHLHIIERKSREIDGKLSNIKSLCMYYDYSGKLKSSNVKWMHTKPHLLTRTKWYTARRQLEESIAPCM